MGLCQQTSTSASGYRNTTMAILAAQKAHQYPDEVAIYLEDGETITYASIYREALLLAAALQNMGLVAGDVISFQLPNWREPIALDIAASLLGLIINPIIPIYRDKEVTFILQDTQAKVILIPAQFRGYDFPAMIERIRHKIPSLQQVVVVGDSEPQSAGSISYHALLDSVSRPAEPASSYAEVNPDSDKIVMYTSGTTGNPKAVRHSHNTLTRALDNGCEAWEIGGGDVMLMPSPVTHITGFANGIELPFYTSAKVVFMEQWQVQRALTLIKKFQVTTCISATPFLQELVEACQASGEGVPSLRLFACGGASVPPSLIHGAHKTLANCRAFRVYGSTETPLVTVGFRHKDREALAAETDGQIFNYDVIICNDDGQQLPQGEDGEILVKGPAMMLGYGNQEQTEQSLSRDGYFYTGDIGHITPEGAIVVTDRKKDIIIRGGENLSAREIEDTLHGHPFFNQVAVVAMPHERLGEGVCACIVLEESRSLPDVESLKAFLLDTGLAKQKWPERYEIYQGFPMTASGKVRKDVLRQEIKARYLT